MIAWNRTFAGEAFSFNLAPPNILRRRRYKPRLLHPRTWCWAAAGALAAGAVLALFF